MVFEKSPVSDAAQAEPDVEPDDAKVNEAMANLSARPGMFQPLPSGHLAIVVTSADRRQADLSKASPKELDKYLVDKAQKVIDRAQKASLSLTGMACGEVQPIQEPGEMSPEDLEIMRQLSEAEGSQLLTAAVRAA